MRGNVGAGVAEQIGAGEAADPRTVALGLMSKALDHLDSDGTIPPVIGAHLQSAIDALWVSVSNSPASINLH